MRTLKLSIITINYQNYDGLSETMQSVFAQEFNNYEYIIVDGGSVDGSKEYIEQYSHKLAYFVSEKDCGIYAAMNKGIRAAKGEYLLFLNSGDYLCSKNVLGDLFSYKSECDLIYGDMKVMGSIKYYPDNLNFSFFLKDSLPHPCTLIRATLFCKYGLYNEGFKISADWAFFTYTVCKFSATYKHVPVTVSFFNTYGVSSKLENEALIIAEREEFLFKHFKVFLADYTNKFAAESELKNLMQSRVYKTVNWIRNSVVGRLLNKIL